MGFFKSRLVRLVCSDAQRTANFYVGVLGQRLVKRTINFEDPGSAQRYWGVGDGRPGTVITYFERKLGKEPRVSMGAGQTHHFALSVPDEEAQLVFRDKLIRRGFRVSPVMDRVYFKSIYTNDPDGHSVPTETVGTRSQSPIPSPRSPTFLRMPSQNV